MVKSVTDPSSKPFDSDRRKFHKILKNFVKMTRLKNKENLTRAYYARVDSDPPACSHSVPNTIRFKKREASNQC